jgi:hypothetical protein
MDSAESVIEAIRLAFDGVPRGKISLHEAEVIDDYGAKGKRDEARRIDAESSWYRVPDAHIEECPNALCHLDPISWKYYVPAYMTWTLRNFRETESLVPEHSMYTFDLSGSEPRVQESLVERYRLLDAAQSRAVCRFLRFMVASDGYVSTRAAKAALAWYWGQFCECQDA